MNGPHAEWGEAVTIVRGGKRKLVLRLTGTDCNLYFHVPKVCLIAASCLYGEIFPNEKQCKSQCD